jgi:hypothetical protein
MPEKQIDIIEFANRVERLCDFILDKIPFKDGSIDQITIQNIKDEAADIQTKFNPLFLDGLSQYIRGG